MRKCPVCAVNLEPSDYEGFRVEGCARCKGHLVPRTRLEGIKHARGHAKEELKAEAREGFKPSAQKRLRCPRCRGLMKKHPVRSAVTISLDVCHACDLVWLDGGELAMVQLAYEISGKGLNDQQLKRRVQELNASPERKREFEENLSKLPREESLLAGVNEDLGEIFGRGLWRYLVER